MNHKTMFSPLTFHEAEAHLFRNQWYVQTPYAIPCDSRTIPPFYIDGVGAGAVSIVKLINRTTGQEQNILSNLGSEIIYADYSSNDPAFRTIMFRGVPIGLSLLPGVHYIELEVGGKTYYSEDFAPCDTRDLLKITWFHSEDFKLSDGTFISYADDYQPFLYFDTGIGKPTISLKEDAEERQGIKFVYFSTTSKVRKFSIIAPEYILDVLKALPQKHYVLIEQYGIEHEPQSVLVNVSWSDKADFARIEIEFETDIVATAGKAKIKRFGDFSASDYNEDYHNGN